MAAPNRPTVEGGAPERTTAEEQAALNARTNRQAQAEAEAVAAARAQLESAGDEIEKDRSEAKKAVNTAVSRRDAMQKATADSTTVILDANSLKASQIAESKRVARLLHSDETRPGGFIYRNGVAVDANGNPIPDLNKKNADTEE